MKYRITMKDPDGPYEAIQEAAKQQLAGVPGLTDEERESLIDGRHTTLRDQALKWLEYGEYVTLEIDTEANTCVVVPRK